MTRFFLSITALLTLLAGSAVYARPQLQPDDRVFDFGCVGIDYQVQHDYYLHNIGEETIKIDSVKTTCDCSSLLFVDSLVAPGDSVPVRVSFTTENYYGPVTKAIKIYSTDPQQPYQELYYSALVGQWPLGLQPKPLSLFFLPGSGPKDVKINNPALESIRLTDIDVLNDYIEVEARDSECKKGQAISVSVVPNADIPKGTNLTNVTVTLELPDADEGLRLTIPVRIVRY